MSFLYGCMSAVDPCIMLMFCYLPWQDPRMVKWLHYCSDHLIFVIFLLGFIKCTTIFSVGQNKFLFQLSIRVHQVYFYFVYVRINLAFHYILSVTKGVNCSAYILCPLQGSPKILTFVLDRSIFCHMCILFYCMYLLSLNILSDAVGQLYFVICVNIYALFSA